MSFAARAGHKCVAMNMAPANPIVHIELHTGNLARACAFYSRLCGWRSETIDAGCGSYQALDVGGGVEGGVVEREVEHGLWLPYAEVADVHTATERARELGAAIVLEPREGPAGWRAVVGSEAAGELALWQPKR